MWVRFRGATGEIVASDGGIRSVTRNGPADYTVELAQAVSPLDGLAEVTANDTIPRTVSVEHLSSTRIRIRFDT